MSTLDATRPASARVSIARLAEQLVAVTPGVEATRGGGRWLTQDGERTIDGIVVARSPSGRVDVELHLLGGWPPEPLPPLAERLRRELAAAVASRELGSLLGQIAISFHDLRVPAESGGEDR